MAKRKDAVLEFLKKTRDVFYGDPEAWTQGAGARTADGKGVGAQNKDAVKFSIVGAVDHVARNYKFHITEQVFLYVHAGVSHVAKKKLPETWEHVAGWNDQPKRTWNHIMAALNFAIDKRERDLRAG